VGERLAVATHRLVASITMDSADASSPRVVARALTLVRCGLSAVAPNFTA